MDKRFRYTILRWRPSLVLGEQINVGLFFFFEDSFEYIFTSDWERAKHIQPNATNTDFLQTASRSFVSVLANLVPEEVKDWSDKRLYHAIMPEPSNALYFSEFRHGSYDDKEQVLSEYENDFFRFEAS
ncbi:MAG: DUF3037 domain-containing protein [Bacteroidota bacterium]